MDITRENYESYFVDYLEGNLDEKIVDRFIEFLQENPDLKEELKLFESVTVIPDDLTFTAKDKLYKAKYDLEEEFNKTAVAEIEKEIEAEEKAAFEKYLATHPEKQKDKELFEKTILHPDENIRFAHKEKLYKKSGRKVFLLWSGRVAAVLILGLAIFSLINQKSETPFSENQVAQVEEKTEEKASTPVEAEDKSEATKKSEPEKVVEQAPKPVIEKKDEPVAEKQSLPEKISTEPIQEEVLPERIPIEIPETLIARAASIDVPSPHAQLAVMTVVQPDYIPDDEYLIGDEIREKVNLKKITRAGLNLVTSISNERFTYETNNDGKVTEYNYDSRILAFSIPSRHTTDTQ